MQSVFDFYEDPGHGWLKVKKQLLRDLQIAHSITSYSYQRGDYAYLEKASDLSEFMHAWSIIISGNTPGFRKHYTYRASRIRNYQCYVTE